MSFSIGQRTREFGVRLALGADRGDIVRLVLGEGLRLAGAGVTIGLALALPLARLLRTLLFGVTTTDPMTFAVGQYRARGRRRGGVLRSRAPGPADRSGHRAAAGIATSKLSAR